MEAGSDHQSRTSALSNNWTEEYVAYLGSINWQWFCTFTVTRPVRNGDDERRSIWDEYLRRIHEGHRDTLGYVWAEDRRDALNNCARIKAHFHAVLVSNLRPDRAMLLEEWAELAGHAKYTAKIDAYDPSLDGLRYVLKLIDRPQAYWGLSPDIQYFLPEIPTGSDCQSRRRFRRHMQRLVQAQRIQYNAAPRH